MSNIFEDKRIQEEDKLHWQVIDKIIYSDGREEVREYYNTVVNDCSRLIASLMKREAGYSGVGYWAVGAGDVSWSNELPPSPTVNDTKLFKETFRKAVPNSAITFLDSSNNPTALVTNKIQITLTFEEAEANGELREFAIFGGNATATKDSGIMINRKIHPIIYKTSDMRIERILRLIF